MKWWHGLIVLILLAGGYGLYKIGSTSPPGQKMPDMGQDHVSPQQVLETKYNSNPPTSGPHLPAWIKPGIYGAPQSEGEVINSTEHRYITIRYNCEVHLTASSVKRQASSKVLAHEEEGSPSASFSNPTIATGSAVNESDRCKTLVKQLTDLAQKKKLFKLIVVPRPQLDTTIALTAWTYVDTFDQFDEERIVRFIDYHRDQGPEKTME